MKSRKVSLFRLFLFITAISVTALIVYSRDSSHVRADMIDANGGPIGTLVLTESDAGVNIRGTVRGLAPGYHGIHICEHGVVAPPDFASAGGHFNPHHKTHGMNSPWGAHSGDMPNILAGVDGVAYVDIFANHATLARDKVDSLLRKGGTSIVIDEKGDDYSTDPDGGAGARIAGGTIVEEN